MVAADGRILGKGRSDYMRDSVEAVIADAGLKATPLKEWCIDWISSQKLRDDIASSTLYMTLEPSPNAKGERLPSITKLIEQAGIPDVVIGCPSPIPDIAYKGASALHAAGISVRVLQDSDPLHQECVDLIPIYSELSNTKVRSPAIVGYNYSIHSPWTLIVAETGSKKAIQPLPKAVGLYSLQRGRFRKY